MGFTWLTCGHVVTGSTLLQGRVPLPAWVSALFCLPGYGNIPLLPWPHIRDFARVTAQTSVQKILGPVDSFFAESLSWDRHSLVLDHSALYRETSSKQSNKLRGEMGFPKCQEGNERGAVIGGEWAWTSFGRWLCALTWPSLRELEFLLIFRQVLGSF